jgi:hypothetical protein
MLSWNLLLTHILPPRPLILIGSGWQMTIQKFLEQQGNFIPEIQRRYISFAPTVDAAFGQLQEILSDGKL